VLAGVQGRSQAGRLHRPAAPGNVDVIKIQCREGTSTSINLQGHGKGGRTSITNTSVAMKIECREGGIGVQANSSVLIFFINFIRTCESVPYVQACAQAGFTLDSIVAGTQGPSTHEVLTTNLLHAEPHQQVHRRASSSSSTVRTGYAYSRLTHLRY
jgi:hypothetical protein